MPNKIEYLNKSWNEFHQDCRILSKKILKEFNNLKELKGIIAISRGGIIPAGILAKELSFRNIDTICIETYTEECTKDELNVLKSPILKDQGKGYIFIDDLIDTGRTIKYIRKIYPKAYIITIYAKPLAKELVDLYAKPVKQNLWVLFPWDLELKRSTPLRSE
jgi:xanthine phosphoribosyltransferase